MRTGIEQPDDRHRSRQEPAGRHPHAGLARGSAVLIRSSTTGAGSAANASGSTCARRRGLVTQAALDAMSDRDVWDFIFAPSFSTAEQVTDLSGRGVGMDVVRTNIAKIKERSISSSVPGQGHDHLDPDPADGRDPDGRDGRGRHGDLRRYAAGEHRGDRQTGERAC